MSEAKDSKSGLVEKILAESRRAADGAVTAPVAIIEAPDRDLLRAFKKATDAERTGLLKLFQKVGARGRRVAEQALTGAVLSPQAASDLLAFLAERDSRHELVACYESIRPALARADLKTASNAFSELPESLRSLWARREAVSMLSPLDPGLAAMLEENSDAARCVLDGLGRDTGLDVLDTLAGLGRATSSRGLQKALRSAFFRLQQIGATVPELTAGTGASTLTETALESHAWISPPDGAGDFALWIDEQLPEGGYAVLQAIVSDAGHLSAARAMTLTRRGHDALRSSLADQRGLPLVAINVPLAMGLLENAYANNPATAGREYVAWRRAQSVDRRALRPEPVNVPESERTALSARSAELYRDGDLAPWLLDRGEAERSQAIVDDASSSTLVLPEPEMAARRERALESAATTVLSRIRRERFARRFEALAIYLRARGDESRAALAAAASSELLAGRMAAALTRTVEDSLQALAQLLEREKNAATGTGEASPATQDRPQPRS